jgi:peptidoglycan hydrolase FlgJ
MDLVSASTPVPVPVSASPPQRPAAGASDEKLHQVAKQFEALFLRELFKGLQKSPEEAQESLFGGSQASQTFDELHHQALADEAAGGLGIAAMVYQQLKNR